MRSLKWKLIGTLILVVVVSVAVTAYTTDRNITREFKQYVCQDNTAYCRNVADELYSFYLPQQSWEGVQKVITSLVGNEGTRLILADHSGLVAGDTSGEWLGQNMSTLGLDGGTAIMVSGREVGQLYFLVLTSSGEANGVNSNSCSMMALGTAEEGMLDRTRRSLVVTGTISAAVALLLGVGAHCLWPRPARVGCPLL